MIYFNRPAPMPTGILSCEVADPRNYYALFIGQTAQNGPEAPRTDTRRPNTPASGVTHEIAAILPATKGKDEGGRMKDEGKAANATFGKEASHAATA